MHQCVRSCMHLWVCVYVSVWVCVYVRVCLHTHREWESGEYNFTGGGIHSNTKQVHTVLRHIPETIGLSKRVLSLYLETWSHSFLSLFFSTLSSFLLCNPPSLSLSLSLSLSIYICIYIYIDSFFFVLQTHSIIFYLTLWSHFSYGYFTST